MLPPRESTGPAFLLVVVVAILVLGLVALAVLQAMSTTEEEQEEPGIPLPTLIPPTQSGGTQYPYRVPAVSRAA